MGSVEEFECRQCGHVFESENGGGFLYFLFRCPSCGRTASVRKGRTDDEKFIDFRALVCENPSTNPNCPECHEEMKMGLPPICPRCRSETLRYRKTVLTYD